MNSSSSRNDDSSTMATGIKAAALVFVLGIIALAADPATTLRPAAPAPESAAPTVSAPDPVAATVFFPAQYRLDAKDADAPPAPTF